MFGEEYRILYEYPEYFLDYREMLDPTIRWTDRLQSSSGDWTGNLFDFFFRVNSKLTKDLKIPFKLEGITRIDDTPVHKALREALANCLVNTDFFVPRGVVIRKDANSITIENPGYIRTGKDQMLKGGISDPRNKALMKMFNMIGIGERAGSGVPDIFAVWESQGWKAPEVEEQYNPDRTILKLSFAKINNLGGETPTQAPTQATQDPTQDSEEVPAVYNVSDLDLAIISLMKTTPTISQTSIATSLNMNINTLKYHVLKLKEKGIIEREGSSQKGCWIVKL